MAATSAFGVAMAENFRNHLFQRSSLAALIAIALSIFFIWYFGQTAPFSGLSREGMLFIGISLAAVVFWIVNVIPAYIVALLMAFSWVMCGLVEPQAALSGFSSPVWLYMVCIFAFGAAIAKSGLLYRLSLHILKAFPKSYTGQLTGLAVSGIVFAPLIPSSTAKVALSASIAQSISEAMGLEGKSRGSAGLGLGAMIFFGYTSSFFLTGSYINLMAWGLAAGDGSISWLQWLVYSAATMLLFSLAMFAAIVFLFKPGKEPRKISAHTLEEQLKILGKPQLQERITAMTAASVLVLLVTQSLHGLDSTWILLGGVAALVIGGVLDNHSIKSGVDWPFLLFMGVSLSFVNVLSQFEIVQALTAFLENVMNPFMVSPYTLLPAVILMGFLITLVIRDEPAVILLVVSILPITGTAGIHPWIIVFAILLSTDPFFFPYQSATYLTAYYSAQESAFTNRQGQRLALCYGAATLLSVLVSVPYWQMVGLIK